MSKLLVSIIIPSFNQGRFIRQTIESILSQSYRPLEVIVVDGASTDDTVEILRTFEASPELRWISEPDSGVVEAVNKGLAMARGRYAAIQSSDDYYLPGAIAAAVESLEADESLSFVFGDILKVDAVGGKLGRTQLLPYHLADLLALRTWIPQPSTCFRLDRARDLGGWREEVPYAADTDLWLRMAFAGKARKLDALLAARRVHPAQRDQHGDRVVRDYDRMLATLEPLRSASPVLRRAARAGQLMLRNRYQPSASAWRQRGRLLRAVALYPPLLQSLHPLALIPGGWWMRRHAASLTRSVRHIAGVVLFDLPRFAPHLIRSAAWWRVCNRQDLCTFPANGPGLAVDGLWSKSLHACTVFPVLGRLLMARALQEWPIQLADHPVESGPPLLSVVIPHRGRQREDQLRCCLASFLAQREASVEIIVVEQSATRELGPLPAGVRHIHLPHPSDPQPWRKSWAYNAGVAAASCDLVICHDGDILVPERYCAELLRRFDDPWLEVLHPQRFLFYLDSSATQKMAYCRHLTPAAPELVKQNWCGGTLAIRREAYAAIGGFDERFTGWGGEDNEFFQRCGLLRQDRYGYIPFVHLWHPQQPMKSGHARDNALAFAHEIMQLPPELRVRNLIMAWGNP